MICIIPLACGRCLLSGRHRRAGGADTIGGAAHAGERPRKTARAGEALRQIESGAGFSSPSLPHIGSSGDNTHFSALAFPSSEGNEGEERPLAEQPEAGKGEGFMFVLLLRR